MEIRRYCIFSVCLFTIVESFSTPIGRILLRSKRSAKSEALQRACRVHACSDNECINEDGWNLYGSDWGCCGNYEGCCTWASIVCYAHDVVCQCCDYGWFCGPDCKREKECYGEDNVETADDRNNTSNVEQDVNEIPKQPAKMLPEKDSKYINKNSTFLHKMKMSGNNSKNSDYNNVYKKNRKNETQTSSPYVKENSDTSDRDVANEIPEYGLMADQPQRSQDDSVEGSGDV